MASCKTDPFPSTDDIAARAHDLFVSGGRRLTRIPEYWKIAEAELLQCAADRVFANEAPRRPRQRPARL